MEDPQPLLICMANASGEDVVLRIEPEDDFQTFTEKARSILGYDFDLNILTKNKTVEPNENMYQFLVNLELNDPNSAETYGYGSLQNIHGLPDNSKYDSAPNQNVGFTKSMDNSRTSHDQPSDENISKTEYDRPVDLNDDQLYVLNDGTQIRASQIHFDNEDSLFDLSLEQLPFLKVNDENDEVTSDVFEDVTYRIMASPVPTTDSSPRHGFINHVPFKLVCNNTTGFEAQFTKYLECSNKTYATLSTVTKKDKSPRSLIRDNFNDKEEFRYTREEILNMLKDSPVTSIPYENNEKKHVRKTDPTKIQKSYTKSLDIEGLVIGDGGNKNCFICGTNVSNDKIYLFDKEDQKIHKCSPLNKTSTQLKIICEKCLTDNFKPSRMKGANQFLNSDEYLVIRNNQQYIFQKTKNFKFRTDIDKKILKDEYVKFEIGSDGEIVTKPVDDDVILVHDARKDSSSDLEILEAETEVDKIIDNLEEADEDVKVFLGTYEARSDEVDELKCRFCHSIFSALSQVIDHGQAHKHDLEDDVVYPCPLCDYGYATFKWLKGHLLAAHDKKAAKNADSNEGKESESCSSTGALVRSSSCAAGKQDDPMNIPGEMKNFNTNETSDLIFMTEVKQEAVSSDDEIWIVQTGDEPTPLTKILESAKVENEEKWNKNCHNCSQSFPTVDAFSTHTCKETKMRSKDAICFENNEDFMSKQQKASSSPQLVTCHNCDQSFTSKVRLKFHMQFHENTPLLSDGQYNCAQCGGIFTTETQLFDHVHFTHEKAKRWQCPVEGCGKTFFLRATLTKHSRTHTDTRRYVCVTCGKRFLDKQTLDEHGVTHLQIKPYQCHICLKQLTRVSRLRMHVRAHEEELSPTLVLVCRVCSRAFRDADHAQEHTQNSTDCIATVAGELKTEEETAVQLSPTSGIVSQTIQVIECPSPQRIFRQVSPSIAAPLLSTLPDEATKLIRVVEVEKAFRCEYCEDVFYTEEGLNSHRAIHKGVTHPFTCHICKVRFATYSRCTTHKTTHGYYKRPTASGVGAGAGGVVGYNDFPTVKHFLCEDCGRSYLHWTYLQVHRRMKHPNQNYLHSCNQCEMTFPNSWGLSYHRKKLHGKISHDDIKTIHNYRIPCRDCDEVLPNKTALYKHRKKEHTGISMQRTLAQRERSTLSRSVQGSHAWACARCPKRFRIRAELRAHTRRDHPASLAVLEIPGQNLTTEEALKSINTNNIGQDRVIEINVMHFAKGSTSVVPNCARALSMLGNVPRTQIHLPRTHELHFDFQPRPFAKNIRRPAILRAEPPAHTKVSQGIKELNIQLLLQGNEVKLPDSVVPV